jgi:hypothetical protein
MKQKSIPFWVALLCVEDVHTVKRVCGLSVAHKMYPGRGTGRYIAIKEPIPPDKTSISVTSIWHHQGDLTLRPLPDEMREEVIEYAYLLMSANWIVNLRQFYGSWDDGVICDMILLVRLYRFRNMFTYRLATLKNVSMHCIYIWYGCCYMHNEFVGSSKHYNHY